ncbi:ATP-binding protein [Kitasatospora sp. NPDC058032]|uniref:ATP-binding protein n=1 Tax=Kitasatospora sp. NPDC058032 TaxID=3346307 RepID=UPI0036DDE838
MARPGSPRIHLAIGLGVKAAHARYSVLFDTADNGINCLQTVRQAACLDAEVKKILRYKLIIIDKVAEDLPGLHPGEDVLDLGVTCVAAA